MEAVIVAIEIGIGPGYGFRIIGRADSAVRESYHRVRSALASCGKKFPGNKMVVSMGPAHLRKAGSSFDLAIAIGVLLASAQVQPKDGQEYLFLGELSMDGGLKPVQGLLACLASASEQGCGPIIIPECQLPEASLVPGLQVFGAGHLSEVMEFLQGIGQLRSPQPSLIGSAEDGNLPVQELSDVRGQFLGKRALEIAAAGGHHLILLGKEGIGKTLLAERLPHLLPPLNEMEMLEVARMFSIAGKSRPVNSGFQRPFRRPHHTIGRAAFLGGGSLPLPGEVTLAHHGILFLDEMQLFRKEILNMLRIPLEEGRIRLNRLHYNGEYPCNFLLVGSANYCSTDQGNGTSEQKRDRESVLFSPVLDRIDLQVILSEYVPNSETERGPSTREVRNRVMACRRIQEQRFQNRSDVGVNGRIPFEYLDYYCPLGENEQRFLETVARRMGFSARARDRMLRVSRTIADLDGKEHIGIKHLAEAVQFRNLDRKDEVKLP